MKNKLKENDIILMKLGKCNSLVLLGIEEYIRKGTEVIWNGSYEEVWYDYTNWFPGIIENWWKERIIFENNRTKLIESNPEAPTFKCQIKLYKETLLVGLMISFIDIIYEQIKRIWKQKLIIKHNKGMSNTKLL